MTRQITLFGYSQRENGTTNYCQLILKMVGYSSQCCQRHDEREMGGEIIERLLVRRD